MELIDLREQIAVDSGDVRLVDLGLQMVILLDGPLAPVLPQVQTLYDDFMNRYGRQIRLASTFEESDMRPFSRDEWQDTARWLGASLRPNGGSFGARFQAGFPQGDQRAPSLDIVHYAPSPELARIGIRIRLPLDELGQGSDALCDRFVAVVGNLPLRHALFGLAPLWSPELHDSASAFKRQTVPKLLRHTGLDIGAFSFHVVHAPAGLMTVDWLTALGSDLAGRIGGPDALRAALPTSSEVTALPEGGLVVRAGKAPEAGDLDRNDRLPDCQAVARALRPLWASDDYIGNIGYPQMEPDLGDAWVARFF